MLHRAPFKKRASALVVYDSRRDAWSPASDPMPRRPILKKSLRHGRRPTRCPVVELAKTGGVAAALRYSPDQIWGFRNFPQIPEIDADQQIASRIKNPDVGELDRQGSQGLDGTRQEPKDWSNRVLAEHHVDEGAERSKPTHNVNEGLGEFLKQQPRIGHPFRRRFHITNLP